MLCWLVQGGANPLLGNHSVDSRLLALLAARPGIQIVTRNSHAEEIAEFLVAKGAVRIAALYWGYPRTRF